LATISGFPESLFASGVCEIPGHATLIVGARGCVVMRASG
jgi:hypothetical protein